MIRLLLCLQFLLLAALALPAHALSLEPQSGLTEAAGLSGHLALRCSADPRESVETVADPARAGEFVAIPGLLYRGYTHHVCWLRFTLQRAPAAGADWLLEVGVPYLDDVTLFMPSPGGGNAFQAIRLGDRRPYAARPVPHPRFVFPLHLPEAEPVTGYLRVQTTSTMLVETMNVWQYAGLLAATQQQTAVHWLVFGLIALGALSYLVFWVWLRESIYGSYAVYLAALFAVHVTNSGIATQWLWPHSPLVADRMVGITAAGVYLLALLFFDRVLGLRRNFPRFRRLIPLAAWAYVVCGIAAATGHFAWVAATMQVMTLLGTVAVTLAGPVLIRRGQKDMLLFTLAFSFQLVISVAVIVRNMGLWTLTLPLEYFAMGATALHIVLLNFALANHVRRIQREKTAMETHAATLQAEQEAVDQQRQFMAMVTHEFRTPLTIIDTSAQRIAGNPQAGADKLRERCDNIQAATQRMTALMDEFLELDRIEGEFQAFAPTACAPAEVVGRVLASFCDAPIVPRLEKLPERMVCDAALLGIALNNLLANALRHSPPDKPVLFAAAELPSGGIEFSVRDDGPGIPADELPRLFQKYFRGRASQTRTGTGLGLYLVERIATLHGGAIDVESSPGQGSCFKLSLPGGAS